MYGMLLAITTSGPALGAVVLNRLAITLVEILLFAAGVGTWRLIGTKKKLPGRWRFRPPHQPILSARRLGSLGGASTYSRSVPGRSRKVLDASDMAQGRRTGNHRTLREPGSDAPGTRFPPWVMNWGECRASP